MSRRDQTVRAPSAHRAIAAIANPVLGYFVARLLLRLTTLPATITYAVCLGVALVLAFRAWSARVELVADRLRVRNTIASTRVPVTSVRRVADSGRVEWLTPQRRKMRLPAESLHAPWWTFGIGSGHYAFNRETVRSWLRAAAPGRTTAEAPSETGTVPDADSVPD
ncbi:hypothetical protein N865_06600 [Intrasporangium oryzae NRRL B-24470]|uniref:PH domain-containing protein n=1 Tax=Intrasporangium oryzae NRRL B-24470 TaxID=1386089 RepID=W9G7T7_9MICO|nr:hypothetical protein [Intrasporangium oryzae]EWT02256.1 hypothetical protein N865_06600 [Intrasporangium oryzae NRRL B-24470]